MTQSLVLNNQDKKLTNESLLGTSSQNCNEIFEFLEVFEK